MHSLTRVLYVCIAIAPYQHVAALLTCLILLSQFATAQNDNPFGSNPADSRAALEQDRFSPFAETVMDEPASGSRVAPAAKGQSSNGSGSLPSPPAIKSIPSMALLRLGQSRPGGPIASVPCDPYMTAEQERHILRVLQTHYESSLGGATPSSLERTLSKLMTVYVNRAAIELLGIDSDTELNQGHDVPAGAIGGRLVALLAHDELTYCIRGNCLHITSVEEAGNAPQLRIYDVSPIVQTRMSRHSLDAVGLIGLCEMHIAPDDWINAGGTNSMSRFGSGTEQSLLVVSCATTIHQQLQSLLDQLNVGHSIEDGPQHTSLRSQRPQPIFDDRIRNAHF